MDVRRTWRTVAALALVGGRAAPAPGRPLPGEPQCENPQRDDRRPQIGVEHTQVRSAGDDRMDGDGDRAVAVMSVWNRFWFAPVERGRAAVLRWVVYLYVPL